MNPSSFLGLIQNAALLLAVAFIFDMFANRWRTGQLLFRQVLVGLAIGAIGITIMLTPWIFAPGIVFDTRSVLIGISGLFFGSLTVIIAMAMTAAFRYSQGGAAAWTGIIVIIISGLIGIAWQHVRRRRLSDISWRELYLFGMVIHLAMLATMFTLPWETALRVLANIALPVILVYPAGTALLGVLMVNRVRRERSDDTLREREEKYRSLVENINEVIYTLDSDGRVTYISPVIERFSSYKTGDLIGRNFVEFIHPDDLPGLVENFNLTVQGELNPFEYRILDGDRVHHVRTSSELILKDGIVTGLTGLMTDITEQRKAAEERRDLQERLNRAEKMEALGTLAGGVAHDLNNVLGVVVGYAELTLDSVDKTSPLRHGLENIMNGGQKAAAIVDDLLTLARRGVPVSSILNLNTIIANFQNSPELNNLSFHHPDVKIKTNLDPDLLNISGSSVHLGKSLYNLISNAHEAMTKGGTLTIKTTNQYLDKPMSGYNEIREGDYVVLTISDTGEGISEKDLKRIFEPFYTKKIMGRSGTGLGLAVVWGTVTDHNGYINVHSEEGKGSTFTLYFPVTREEIPDEALAIDVSAYMGSGQSILIVDDVSIQRELARDMLQKLNYNVSSVKSGEEAILYLKDHQPDLIVLDMIMDPGMDGLDTYKSIIKINPQQKTIIVSGFSESDRVKEAKRLGAGAYVRKPYIKEKLGMAVKKELERAHEQ